MNCQRAVSAHVIKCCAPTNWNSITACHEEVPTKRSRLSARKNDVRENKINIRFRGFRLTQHCCVYIYIYVYEKLLHLKMVVRPKHVAVNGIK
jgi:hypothetical protein